MGKTAKMTSQSSTAAARAQKKTTRKKRKKKPTAKKRTAKKKTTKKSAAKKRATKKTASAPPVTTAEPERMAPSTSLTPQPSPRDGAERRRYERHDVPGLIEVEIEMFGYQRDQREFGIGPTPGPAGKINSFGATVNLSLSGMLAEVADPIIAGSHCLVRFVNAGAGLQPELRWGLIVRCSQVESGRFEVAVNFDSPLEHLDVGAIAAAASPAPDAT